MPTIVDSYSETNRNTQGELNISNKPRYGQSFTGTEGVLESCTFFLKKSVNEPTGNIFAEIYSHSGTYGTSSLPDTLLATSDYVDPTNLTTSFTLQNFIFSGANKIDLVAGTKYVIVVAVDEVNATSPIIVGLDTTSPTHSGNACRYSVDSSTWGAINTWDVPFYVYRDSVSSPSASISFSPSVSISPSLSPSLSPSASTSPSLSPSASTSPSLSSSASPSPSPPPPVLMIKVAKPGYNAETDTNPDHFIFWSKYNTFKILKEGNAQITYTGDGRYAISHNLLSYSPTSFMFFIKFPDGYTLPTVGTGFIKSHNANWEIYDVYIDETEINMHIKRIAGANTVLNSKYYIFETPF